MFRKNSKPTIPVKYYITVKKNVAATFESGHTKRSYHIGVRKFLNFIAQKDILGMGFLGRQFFTGN